MITTDKTQLNINVLTQEQYEQAKADETLDQDGLYMVDDDVHQMGVELDFNGLEKRELLWTNSNPTSAFAAQTIALDLSGYDEVEITYLLQPNLLPPNSREYITRIIVGRSSYLTHFTNTTSTGYLIVHIRNTSITNTGVSFQDNYYKYVSQNTPTLNNGYSIPTKIYGIKKLQPSYNVIPQQVDYVVDNRDGKRLWKSGKVDDYNMDFLEVYGTKAADITRTLSTADNWFAVHTPSNWRYRSINGVDTAPNWAIVPSPEESYGAITIAESGFYKIEYQVYFYNSFTAGDNIVSGILLDYKNQDSPGNSNGRISRGKAHVAGAYVTVGGYCIVECQSGQNLRLGANNTTGGRGTVSLSAVSRMLITKM